jgi:hypothetical protein
MSHGKASYIAIANAVLPDAVGPIKQITGGDLAKLLTDTGLKSHVATWFIASLTLWVLGLNFSG